MVEQMLEENAQNKWWVEERCIQVHGTVKKRNKLPIEISETLEKSSSLPNEMKTVFLLDASNGSES